MPLPAAVWCTWEVEMIGRKGMPYEPGQERLSEPLIFIQETLIHMYKYIYIYICIHTIKCRFMHITLLWKRLSQSSNDSEWPLVWQSKRVDLDQIAQPPSHLIFCNSGLCHPSSAWLVTGVQVVRTAILTSGRVVALRQICRVSARMWHALECTIVSCHWIWETKSIRTFL